MRNEEMILIIPSKALNVLHEAAPAAQSPGSSCYPSMTHPWMQSQGSLCFPAQHREPEGEIMRPAVTLEAAEGKPPSSGRQTGGDCLTTLNAHQVGSDSSKSKPKEAKEERIARKLHVTFCYILKNRQYYLYQELKEMHNIYLPQSLEFVLYFIYIWRLFLSHL